MTPEDSKNLQIGERVDVSTGPGADYRTILEDITEDGRLIISPPMHRGVPVVLRRNEKVELCYYRESGRYCIDVGVLDFSISNNVRLIILDVLSLPRRSQRRGAYRLAARLDVRFLREEDAPREEDFRSAGTGHLIRGVTEDISETGIRVKTGTSFAEGDKVWMKLSLKDPEGKAGPIVCRCEIVRVFRDSSKERAYGLGMRFMDCSGSDRARIARFVLAEQRKDIRRQRWLKEE